MRAKAVAATAAMASVCFSVSVYLLANTKLITNYIPYSSKGEQMRQRGKKRTFQISRAFKLFVIIEVTKIIHSFIEIAKMDHAFIG